MLNKRQGLFPSSLFGGGSHFSISWESGWSLREVYKRICKAIRNEGANSRRRVQDSSISALTAFQAIQFLIVRDCAVYYRTFSNIPGLQPLDAGSILPIFTNKNTTGHCQMSPGGQYLLLVEGEEVYKKQEYPHTIFLFDKASLLSRTRGKGRSEVKRSNYCVQFVPSSWGLSRGLRLES